MTTNENPKLLTIFSVMDINKLEETMSLVISDLRNINSLAVGTLETIKRMPDYQEALDKLKEEAAKADEAAEKEKK